MPSCSGHGAVPAEEDLHHRGLEVVMADAPRHPTEVLERLDMSFEERLLGLVGEGNVEAPAGVAEAHAEYPALGQGAVDVGGVSAVTEFPLR
jgi:hypothetical protein